MIDTHFSSHEVGYEWAATAILKSMFYSLPAAKTDSEKTYQLFKISKISNVCSKNHSLFVFSTPARKKIFKRGYKDFIARSLVFDKSSMEFPN